MSSQLVRVEEKLAFLEKFVSELNEVVIEQSRQTLQLEKRLGALEDKLNVLGEREAQPRRLEDDKPPHY